MHRDVKPSNIIVARGIDGLAHLYLIDFGVAKFQGTDDGTDDGSANPDLTGPSASVGTLAYMAPEQRGSSKDVDARADIFSLGVVLYEMLHGRHPFKDGWRPAWEADAVIPGRSDGSGPPAALVASIRRCLSAEPADRFSVRELAEVLASHASSPVAARVAVERIARILEAADCGQTPGGGRLARASEPPPRTDRASGTVSRTDSSGAHPPRRGHRWQLLRASVAVAVVAVAVAVATNSTLWATGQPSAPIASPEEPSGPPGSRDEPPVSTPGDEEPRESKTPHVPDSSVDVDEPEIPPETVSRTPRPTPATRRPRNRGGPVPATPEGAESLEARYILESVNVREAK